MKSSTRSVLLTGLLAGLLALIVAAGALVLPSSAQARNYAWGYWSHRTLQVKTRVDGYSSPGTTSAWQFQRSHRQTGKRQVRVIYRTWYVESNTFGPTWTTGPWKGIKPGQKKIVTGPLVFGCYYRDGRIGAQMVAQVRNKVHGHWAAPRDLATNTGSFIFNC